MEILKKLMWVLLLALLASCSKDDDDELRLAPGLEGTWVLKMVNANDHWGGPLYWRDVQRDKQVRFTADGKYYEKQDNESDFTLIGSYEVSSDEEITVTWAQPLFPENPSYTVNYYLEPGNYLVLETGQLEGVVSEKYQLIE